MGEPEPVDLVAAVLRHAASDPDRVALTWLDGLAEPGESVTYGALDDLAATVAGTLLANARPGDRVLLVQPPGLGFVTAFLGCLYAGCVPVPVYPLVDTEDNVAIVRRVLADSGAVLAWTADQGAADHLARILPVPVHWKTGADRYRPDRGARPDQLAFLQYTSGSTADPRGVMVTHGSLAANLTAIAAAFGHDADTVVLSWLPAYHDMGLIGNILHPLHTGFPAYLASPLDFISRPLNWPTAVARFGVTTSGGPNFAYDLIVRAAGRDGVPELDLSAWRVAYCGAEPVSARTLGRFAELLAPRGFRADALVPCYGLAEATLLVTSAPVGRRMVTAPAPDGGQAVSCGVPRDCEVVVVDGKDGPAADGEVGEILVRGDSVAAGYLGKPTATKAVFGATARGRNGSWLRTGDLGFLDRGELYVTGRIKDLMVVRGRNHHPQDVERLVTENCPPVRPGCVAAFASPDGEGAVVVAEIRPGRTLTAADRRAATSAAVNALGLRLVDILAVPRNTVPKTTSGKLRRGECRTRYLSGEYERFRAADAGAEVARGGTDGDAVLGAVREVLGVEPEPDVPLAGYGLDSLSAVRLAEHLVRETGVDVPVRELLRGATLTDLARAVSARPRADGLAARPDGAGSGRLSAAQESLLFLHMMNPTSTEYLISFAFAPAAGTDLGVLDRAIQLALSWRSELWTRLSMRGDTWLRVPVDARRRQEALSPTTVDVEDDRLEERLASTAATLLDLEQGPLLRLYRHRTPTRLVYQVVAHHLVTDLWSLCLALRDVGSCYAELLAGREPTAPVCLSYDDYVREQEAYLASAAAAARDDALRRLLPTRERPVDVRTDLPRGPRRGSRAGRVSSSLTVPPSPGRDIVALMITLWAAVLHRYGTPTPVVVGVPVSGRGTGRHATVAGLCTNTVPVAVDTSLDAGLSAATTAVRDQLDEGMDAGMYPLARAVAAVRPARAAGRHPLVETLVTVHENPLPEVPAMLEAIGGLAADLELGPLSLRSVPVPVGSCRYDLDLVVTPRDGGYRFALDYAADLFTQETASALLTAFQDALAAALVRPDALLGDLLALSRRDAALLNRIGWSEAGPLTPPLLDRVRAVAAEDPGRPAVVRRAGTWDYGDFVARVDQVADAVGAAAHPDQLASEGGRSQVAVLVESSADFAVVMFAAWSRGLGVLPLPTDHPDRRLAGMLADCSPAVLVTCPAQAARARRLATAGAAAVPVLELSALLKDPGTPCPSPPPPPTAPAFTVYTSGSTGTPKGVRIRHDQISPLVAWCERQWGLGPWARIAQTLSLGFDFGLQELFTILPTGGCVVVPDRDDRRSARDYARFLRRERVTVLFTTPSYADELAANGEPLPQLRLVLVGGEVLRRSTVVGLRALVEPGCRLVNGYGPTEATVNCLMYEIPWSVSDDELPEVLPVGTATANSRIHLVDAANRPVPVGALGELLVGGPGVADGYLGRPERTAERFVRLDLDPDRLYRTGDLAYVRPDSGYVVVGRADRQVKVRGFRVELGEVEKALVAAPTVHGAVVRVIGDHGDLTAFLVGERVDLDVVARHLAEVLPPAMVPSTMIPLESLPRTTNGKLDEAALERLAARVGPTVLVGTASPADVEAAVCEIWAEVLSVSEVDAGSNVFDLGAHSLAVTRVHSWLQASAGVTFPVHEIFDHPRPCDLARRITAHRRAGGVLRTRPDMQAVNGKEEA
ncbi:non-ribosomal peptide synthetase [Actinophytocola xanthii]|uniref:Carrier domain-containing protein n=1 Tax=Actinophytocola xanthii TaxID=1912961 RepID=A0A1Q8CK21_9PSEU|nr:non-ribosomal peptide synthetase [Actinophytocola xanthii]OLF14718.1 hypothetical protein BU204_25855 [Actinophytocola xanthii]